ncbi:leucyl/phenylalanyl-tRNA--protein transferase [Xinfangfangia sp. D13-10-4-6]|uniref:leucyl/phenylalanyl-tRNA--protein transferase n=1 Tax=Pseudogemmobacter hezensis TaxID=2737662 RepID=UPI0015542AB8|nr:leucyl/phenylalanyl-tRNA--protein transferase [Pseudogemmobacter hezensis]NPD15806.1 leucyl/phenylalanyl-tRNA--protein transferase [Pseudogemmobacter hezensis]
MSQITPELLLHAYAAGVFPMAEGRDDPEIHWVDPRKRGILPLDGFHISRSLAKTIRRSGWRVTVNEAFTDTVLACADRAETWINAEILDLYQRLHEMGFAHSLEVYEDREMVGGVYGVSLGAAFFGESMFSRRTDASKLALAFLVHRLRAGGYQLLDTQFITPHLASLGGTEIPRAAYHQRLKAALAHPARFTPEGYSPSPSSVLSGVSTVSGGL